MRKNNTLPNEVKTVLGLPECWIVEDTKYVHIKNSVRDERLPIIEAENRELLDKMSIPYFLVTDGGQEVCVFWDSKYDKVMELTLPVYVKSNSGFAYKHIFHTGRVPAEETIQKAKELEKKVSVVKREAEERKAKEEAKRQIQNYRNEVKKLVAGKQAVGHYFRELTKEMAEKVSSAQIKVLPVLDNGDRPTGYFAIFNLAEISGREDWHVTLEVAPEMVRKCYGSNYWQVAEWKKLPWARKRNITKFVVVAV